MSLIESYLSLVLYHRQFLKFISKDKQKDFKNAKIIYLGSDSAKKNSRR